ncbi:MAG: winged helix-turn-helix transcriptional regulator [Acidobacteria bacterium]|nr:winged helix-turn-helix transcriptional regulator [Acidobacteriota bacterium]
MILFGPYRIDERQHQLLLGKQSLKIEKIPLEILMMLIRERDRVVSREEIADKVWGRDKYVEAADGINTAIRKVRRAIDDNADEPRYVRTVIGRGYQFIGDVKGGLEPVETPAAERPDRWRLSRLRVLVAGAVLLSALAGWLTFRRQKSTAPAPFVSLVRLTSDSGYTGWPDISPDGKMLVYASNRADADNFDIYLQAGEGSKPIRLTDHPAGDVTPVISPKGDQVAFESLREPPGIYVVPLLGGEARLLVKGGARPRYSPDGAWIAYFTFDTGAHVATSWVMPASGGEPMALRTELDAGSPIWAGNDFLILTGKRKPNGDQDWWVTPRDGTWVKQLGVFDALRKIPENFARAWIDWWRMTPAYFENGSVVFSARKRDGANLWRIRFSADWTLRLPPERVTMMNDSVRWASASANGRIAAEVMSRNIDVYDLPLDANTGVVQGEQNRLTWAKTMENFPSVSGDGTLVAYTSFRTGDQGDLYLLDRRTGVERQLTATAEVETFPRMSPDGTSVVYNWFPVSGKQISRRMHLASGLIQPVCELCAFMDQTADGKSFLYGELDWKHIFVKDFSGGAVTEPVHDESYRLAHAGLDGANRWIAFVASKPGDDDFTIYAAPFRRNARLGRRDWVEIGKGSTPLWSPNGEWLYFDKDHDGFRCLFRRRFEPVAGRPAGETIAVAHFHGDKSLLYALPWKDRGLARDRIVFAVREATANIWLMQ